MQMTFHKSLGSEIIESAIVIPLTFLIVFSLLSVGIDFMQKTKNSSLKYEQISESIIKPSFSQEDMLRLKWAKSKDNNDKE